MRPVLLVLGAVVALGLLKLAVLALEPRLTFLPQPLVTATPADFGMPFEELVADTEDGLRLRSWFIPARAPASARASAPGRPALTVLLFHGNAENLSHSIDLAARLHQAGRNVLLAEYRGYAGNPGAPTERGLYLDGEAALRAVRSRSEVASGRIVLWGRSIGGAVAVHLAAREAGVAGLILESPFTSARDLLLESGAYLFYGLSFLGSYRFNQAALLGGIRVPVLVIHGTRDEVVPFRLGRRVHDLAGGPKRFVAIEGGGHNDLRAMHGDALWGAASGFLGSLDDKPAV